jgi:drug/metabolite transporter (DMT)-like permease
VTAGIATGFVSGLFFMTRNLITKTYRKTYSGSVLMFWQTAVIAAVLLPVLFADPRKYAPETAWLIALLGICFTAVPHSLFSTGLKHVSAQTAGVINCLLPLYAGVFGYLIHDETLSMRTLAGGAVILAAVLIETVRSIKQG